MKKELKARAFKLTDKQYKKLQKLDDELNASRALRFILENLSSEELTTPRDRNEKNNRNTSVSN